MNASSLKLGFIGLGIMGAPMCGHLIAAGHQLFVNTVGKVPANIAEASATQCTTARVWPSAPTSSSSWCPTPRRGEGAVR
jgi:6-phosphogluconate dehydrogenase (decarboxylating)